MSRCRFAARPFGAGPERGPGPKGVILHGGSYQFSTPAITYGPRPRRNFQARWAQVMASGHLLVIDDSPTVLKVIELALSQAGYAVSTAADEEAGLALVREARTVPDLILLDGLIPNRDAAEICRRFAADPALQRVPVVVMVARGQGDEIWSRASPRRRTSSTSSESRSRPRPCRPSSHMSSGSARRSRAGPRHPVRRRHARLGRRAGRGRRGARPLGGRARSPRRAPSRRGARPWRATWTRSR